MGIILALILGGFIGWLAAAVTGQDEGIFGSMAIGVIGAIIGDELSAAISGTGKTYLGLSWSGILWSFIGALILAALLGVVRRTSHHRVNR